MPHPLHDRLRHNIQRLVQGAGYRSFELFAHEHGLDKSTVSRILAGSREPKVCTLEKIRVALGVDWNALLADQPSEPLEPDLNSSTPNV
jgi:transcriptional regulator with XRE-family HTH domain